MEELPKRYFCKECDKSFSQSQSLRNHTKIVHQGFKFKCDSCDKTFNQKRSLKSHAQIVHTDIEPKNNDDKRNHEENDQGNGSKNKFSPDEELVLDETSKKDENYRDENNQVEPEVESEEEPEVKPEDEPEDETEDEE